MIASAFGNVACTQGLRLENLWQKKGRLPYHFAKGVFCLKDLRRRRRPPTVALHGARSFFRNELGP
jgi:hypothetical protein